MVDVQFKQDVTELIDNLKGICAENGLGNDGNEFKIITQVFLYKFLNDKFAYEVKQIDPKLAAAESWENAISAYSDEDYQMLLFELGGDIAQLQPRHFIKHLFDRQLDPNFSELFDDTLQDIAVQNNEVFAVQTEGGAKVVLFEKVSNFVNDESKRDDFCRAIINQLLEFSFENIFTQKYDFFATIFEYLISDYNKDSGGKYAEYYTPHAVARIMAAILVPDAVQNVSCYDPAAGSGTLLMSLAHTIGEDKCAIYSQDISQKSSSLLRLNLILNNLVSSIKNIIEGDTLKSPYHREGKNLKKFDYIVSNPPFKLDFSKTRDELDTKENNERFFAGIPNIPPKDKSKMSIYSVFLQHIMFSLNKGGKAAIVVPTGFIMAQSGIDKKIRKRMVESKMIKGVVSMPSNIFATTGTNVSIVFLDKNNQDGKITLIDAAKLGEIVKEGKNQKTVLTSIEEQQIINAFSKEKSKEDFSVKVSYDDIKNKNYSLSAGQYFDVKIEYVDISEKHFNEKMSKFASDLKTHFKESTVLDKEILSKLKKLNYGN